MEFVFYTLATLLILLSYRSFRGGLDYLGYFRKELDKSHSEYTPFATIICPCKGLDAGLAENLARLFEQDYPACEVIFVVDDENDTAVSVIKDASRNDLKVSKLVVAPKAAESSQKVENLREAVLHADERAEVFVFVDSDARTSTDWLRGLVAPLEDSNVGASTGYRWFISKELKFASELLNIWNASIASALGSNTRKNFCWGGSMAIRRETFEKFDIREKWRGTLSDDFTLTRAMNAAKLPIVFVPQALTASIDDCSFREMLEFTTRQMKITRVYMPKLWIMSFLGSGLFCVVMTWSLLITMFSRHNDVSVWIAVVTLALVSALSAGKSYLRSKAVRLVLQDHTTELRKQMLPQLTLWFVSPFVFLINSFAPLVSRRVAWRGITYELVSAKETGIIANSDER
ncbi:MAG: hypothetical protein DMF62_17870 [Acidobacteria bacterium]|nr:MAG: hypothetical protein DMF62_17870 [Acidobacteriota bacterium]